MTYRKLNCGEITRELFLFFERHQEVTQCWRKTDGQWGIRDISFTEQWDEEDFAALVRCLRNTLSTGGAVFGAFDDTGRLKGFSSVEGEAFGTFSRYLDLSCLHVSEEMRGRGTGKMLFTLAAEWAKEQGADKLYISGHSSVETQAFYKAMGCTEAAEYNIRHVLLAPDDCQLELKL